MSLVPSEWLANDISSAIGYGYVAGVNNENKFGYNPAIANVEEDIWTAGGLYTWPSDSGQAMVLTSTNVADDQQIVVSGLDENFLEKTEIATLNGQANVALGGLWARVHRMVNIDSTRFLGSVTVEDTGNTTEFAIAEAVDQRTHMSVYTVPANKSVLIRNFQVFLNKAGGTDAAITVNLKIRPFGGVFLNVTRAGVSSASSSFVYVPVENPVITPPKSDIIVSAISSVAQDSDISASYGMREIFTDQLP